MNVIEQIPSRALYTVHQTIKTYHDNVDIEQDLNRLAKFKIIYPGLQIGTNHELEFTLRRNEIIAIMSEIMLKIKKEEN